MGPSSSSKSVSATGGSSTEFNLYSEPSASLARSNQNILPSHHSGTQLGIWDTSQSMHSAASTYVMPTEWQGYNGAPGTTAATQQYPLSSATILHPLHNQASEAMGVKNLSDNVPAGHSLSTSNSIYLTAAPPLTFEQLPTPFDFSLSSKSSMPFHHSTIINSNGLTMPFSLTYQNASSIDAQIINKVVPGPVSSLPVQSSTYSASSVSDPISDPFLWLKQTSSNQNLSQPKLSEHSPEKRLYPDQKDKTVVSSISLNLSSPVTTPAAQPPLLPLPPPSQKVNSLICFFFIYSPILV